MSDFTTRIVRKNKNNETDLPLTISSKDGLVDQVSFFNKTVASKDMSGYYLIRNGEFAYNKSYSVGYDFGSIKRLDRYPMGALSTLYICFELNKHNSDFVKTYFDSLKWYKEIYLISAEGARNHGLLNIPTEDFFDSLHYIPSEIEEQEKIADFLMLVNQKIQKQQQLVELLKKYKKGLEIVLFSTSIQEQNGWKNVPLKNIGYFFGGLSGKTKDDFGHGEGLFITYMNAYSNTFAKEDILMPVEINKNEKQNTIRYGDIIFTQSSETTEDVGLSSVWLHSSSPYLNSFCMALRPYNLDEIDSIYMGFVLRSNMIRTQIMKAGQGISRINLSSKRIENICIPIPSLEKQKEIGNFLFKIEYQIKINSDLIEKLSIEKKGLLQQLFI